MIKVETYIRKWLHSVVHRLIAIYFFYRNNLDSIMKRTNFDGIALLKNFGEFDRSFLLFFFEVIFPSFHIGETE